MTLLLQRLIAVGWLWGAAVWAQNVTPPLAPVDDEKTVRRHIAWLISEQFGLEQERFDKLDAALSAEPVPLEEEFAVRWGGTIPVWILDEVVTSRNGVLVLADVLNREQLEVFLASIQARKDRAERAATNRTVAVLDSILSLSPEQRKQVNSVLNNKMADQFFGRTHNWADPPLGKRIFVLEQFHNWADHLLGERIFVLKQLAKLANLTFPRVSNPNNLTRLLTEPQRGVWLLVQEICLMRPQLMEQLIDERSFRYDVLGVELLWGHRLYTEIGDVLWENDPGEIDGLSFVQRSVRQALAQGTDPDELMRSRDPGAIGDVLFGEKNEDRNPVEKFVMAVLEAHAELFGELDEAAIERLTLAGRGTFRQMLSEEKSKAARSPEKQVDREPRRVIRVPRRGEERKIENLPKYTRSLWERILRGVADFPLYRRTVEKVLSQEAYAEYSAIRRERANFQLTAKRQAVLAHLDLRVLLSRKQRDHAEAWLAQSDTNLSISELYRKMTEELDRELFTDWQRSHWR